MSSLLERIEASAVRIADLRKSLRAEMDRRDSLICEAIDTRHKYAHVSRASKRAIGTVAAIVGRGDPLDPERQERQAEVFTSLP